VLWGCRRVFRGGGFLERFADGFLRGVECFLGVFLAGFEGVFDRFLGGVGGGFDFLRGLAGFLDGLAAGIAQPFGQRFEIGDRIRGGRGSGRSSTNWLARWMRASRKSFSTSRR
jgi:hypothetical protein